MPRCTFVGCTRLQATIVGECLACGGKFCLKHRLPEPCGHACPEMDRVRQHMVEQTALRNKSTVCHLVQAGGGGGGTC